MKTAALSLVGLLLPAAAVGIMGCFDSTTAGPLDSGGAQDSTAGKDAGGGGSDATGGADSTSGNDGSGGSDGSMGRDGPSGSDAGTPEAGPACDMTARPACTATSANCVLVDDFDRRTDAGAAPAPPVLPPNEAGITGTWVVSADTTDGGVTLPNPFSATAGGAGDAGDPYAMWFFSSGHPIYSDFEISFLGADGGANGAWNASTYSGIQFWAKKDALDGGSTVAPHFSFKTIPAGFSFGTNLPTLTTDWQLVYVPFCSLFSTTADAGIDPSQFSGLAFTIASPFGIWIDQVYLVK